MTDTNSNCTLAGRPNYVSLVNHDKNMKSRLSVLQENSPRTPRLTLFRVDIHEVVHELVECCLGNSTLSSLTGISLLCARGCKFALGVLPC